MRPCKVCSLEVDCDHREGKPLSQILEKTEAELLIPVTVVSKEEAREMFGGYKEGYNAGLKRAVEIVKERSKVFASPEEAGEREWSGLTIAAIEAELNVETEDEHQARISGISYNGD